MPIKKHKANCPIGLDICITCCRPKFDPIHWSSFDSSLSVKQMLTITGKPSGMERLQVEKQNHVFVGTGDICESCLKSKIYTEHLEKQVLTIQTDGKSLSDTNHKRVICNGHKCPQCDNSWNHDYTCNHDRPGLCHKCASQLSVEINRPKNIESIAVIAESNAGHVSGAESVSRRLNSESSVFTLLHNPDNTLKINWLELWEAHYLDLERKIQLFRIDQSVAHKAKADAQMTEMSTLTPEEAVTYARRAARQKKTDVEKEKVAKDKAAEKKEYQIAKTAALLQATVKGLSKEDARKRAELMFQ